MSLIVKRKCTLEKMNGAISNPTFAAVAVISIVLGVASVTGVTENTQKINKVVELIQNKIHIGSVMNTNYTSIHPLRVRSVMTCETN
jgi:hypothetical protein